MDTLARGPEAAFPTSIAFAPDGSGRFFFTEKNSGRVRIYDRGLVPQPFVTVSVENDGEQGLLGAAVHPKYPDTPWVYLYYTRQPDGSNVVERYRDSAGIGIEPKLLLIVPRLVNGTTNNGGGIRFGPDGKLYVAVGDYGLGRWTSGDTTTPRNPRGKILRLNPDGSLPADNPFPGKPFWAIGLANSTGLTFDSVSGEMYCAVTGSGSGEELVRVQRGANLSFTPPQADPEEPASSLPALWHTAAGSFPGLAAIDLYRGDAFPRLKGKLLFGGTASPVIQEGTLNGAGDSLEVAPLFRSLGGFSAIETGPEGDLYLVNGPYFASRILRLVPVAPGFGSLPSTDATQDKEYSYTPRFTGTPPALSVMSGPPGMVVDSVGTVRWTPTNDEALQGTCAVTLIAENGAGSAQQDFTISVENINDPPSTFSLDAPADNASFGFFGGDPAVRFSWARATDPDRDTVRYFFEIDTSRAFDSPALRDSAVGTADSLLFVLPKTNAQYYWRVFASDGRLNTPAVPPLRGLLVSFLAPVAQESREKLKPSVLEQNYPNPFNPATSIKYTIPHGGHVKLTVFNLLGQEVVKLFDGVQGEGTYEFEFNRANLPSGIYFYRIQAPGFVETKKMVVTR